ncbi:MAG: hypothetical protein Q9226_000142 [Calogaya cf. arnoldii]
MTPNPDFASLNAILKKLEENDEDLRQIAEEFPHSEPASRSRQLLLDEIFLAIQTGRREAVAELKSLQPKWETGLSALEEEKSKYERKSLELGSIMGREFSVKKREDSIGKRENIVAKREDTVGKREQAMWEAYEKMGKVMKESLGQGPGPSPHRSANVANADATEKLVQAVSELQQQVLTMNNTTRQLINQRPRDDPPTASLSRHDHEISPTSRSRPDKRPAQAGQTERQSRKRGTPTHHGEGSQSPRHSESMPPDPPPRTRQSIGSQLSRATTGTPQPASPGVDWITETPQPTESPADSPQPQSRGRLFHLRSCIIKASSPQTSHALPPVKAAPNIPKDIQPGTQAPKHDILFIWPQIQLKGPWTDENRMQLHDFLEETSRNPNERYHPRHSLDHVASQSKDTCLLSHCRQEPNRVPDGGFRCPQCVRAERELCLRVRYVADNPGEYDAYSASVRWSLEIRPLAE